LLRATPLLRARPLLRATPLLIPGLGEETVVFQKPGVGFLIVPLILSKR
jgi:hypothetical protein